MSDISRETFSSADFIPEQFVLEMARSYVGGDELLNRKAVLQTLCDDTAQDLKRNVYENHMQFIETATEISHLEAEMYKLSHLLSDQRTVLTSLTTTSILGNDTLPQAMADKTESEAEKIEEQRASKLTSITENVENCMDLFDIPDRKLLHEGDILEMDAEEHTALQRMHAYLFNDCLMLTSWISNRRGNMRYKFECTYPISKLAVVNVRDQTNVKQEFKLLSLSSTRLFQCNNLTSKNDWLDKFEMAKKSYLEKLEENDSSKAKEVEEAKSESIESPVSLQPDSNENLSLPDWLADVVEELDVLIVERNFEKVYDLMISTRDAFKSEDYANHPKKSEILDKVEFKEKNLIELLMKELEVTPEWSPRGGLRSVRNSINILNKFKMTSQACDLFLAICSHTVKIHIQSVPLEGSTTSYVKHVGDVFFCTLSDVLTEYLASFPKYKVSALVVWASEELRMLMIQIIKQIFTPQSSLQSISECTESLRGQSKLFCEYGIDLCFQLDISMRAPLIKGLKDYKEKIVDSMKPKVLEDKWTPVNMHTKVGVNKFLQQMEGLGLILAKYVINETWIDLSSSTIWFTQSILTIQLEGHRMVTKDMMDVLDECIFAIFNARLNLSIGNDSSYSQKNFKFLLDVVMPLMLRKYTEEVGYDNEKLLNLAKKYGVNFAASKKTTSKVTKYSSSEYL